MTGFFLQLRRSDYDLQQRLEEEVDLLGGAVEADDGDEISWPRVTADAAGLCCSSQRGRIAKDVSRRKGKAKAGMVSMT